MNQKKHFHILIVEDNPTMREGMEQILLNAGYLTTTAENAEAALQLLRQKPFQLVITDNKMAGMSGLDLLKMIKQDHPDTEVMIVTAFATIDLAVEAMKAGARDFITKPFSKDELLIRTGRLEEIFILNKKAEQLQEENEYLREEAEVRLNYGEIVGESAPMKKVYKIIKKISMSSSSVLISGESGTGKELAARAIHRSSLRKSAPFIRVNCGALAEGLLESELFGHEKGAFTGALRRKKGRFELADKGSLFLDEIGEIPQSTQIKLLRVLQEKEFERVGGEETLKVDVRVIAATNRDLAALVKTGKFREDLYYRLFILPLEMPALKNRREDIPLLAAHFLKQIKRESGRQNLSLSLDALAALAAYHWPGNIRELGNVIERAAVLSDIDEISGRDLQLLLTPISGTDVAHSPLDLESHLDQVEKEMLEKALFVSKDVKARAARLLGIKESALYYKLEKHGLYKKR